MKFIKILPIIFFAFIFSCDKIDIPLKKQANTCGKDTIPIRKILVEDYTGHLCNNCPEAAEILHEIKNDYCDHIIPLAIHVSSFANPINDSPFSNNYKTDAGNELDEFYQVSNEGLPNGLVNRKKYNNSYIIGKGSWETAVNKLYSIPADVHIAINSSYNPVNKEITATISSKFLFNVNYAMNIGLYITEDSIVSPQLSKHGVINDYVHRHMLRKSITGAFGESFVSSALIDDVIEKTFTFTINEDWNINHLGFVAFISNTETKEIIQAEYKHLEH